MPEKKWTKYVIWGSLAVFYLLCFKIVLDSGYMYDDKWTHVERGMIINEGRSYLDVEIAAVIKWYTTSGRIMIFSNWCGVMLNYVPLAVYKFLIVTAVILDAAVFGAVLKELGASSKTVILCAVLFPAVVSMDPTYFSAMYGFHALIQVVMLLVLLAVYSYIRYRKTGNIRWQVLSSVLWFISLGVYELAYALCILFIAAMIILDGWQYVRKNLWKSIKTGLPQIIVMLAWLAANWYARLNATQQYAGSTSNLDIGAFIHTFMLQCSGSLGVGAAVKYFRDQSWDYWFEFIREYIGIYQVILYILFFAVVFLVLQKMKYTEMKISGLVVFGLLMIVLPASIISVSVRYQEELGWFKGYIPQYIQSWGLALILAVGVFCIGKKIKNRKSVTAFNAAVAVLFTACFAFDNVTGASGVEYADSAYQYSYDTVNDSIKAGLLNDAGDGIILDVSYSEYNYDAECTARAYATMMLKSCSNYLGWDDLYETDENTGDRMKTEYYEKVANSNIKVLAHQKKIYNLLTDSTGFQSDWNAEKYDYEYSLYTKAVDIFVYDNVSESFMYEDKDGKTITVYLSDLSVKSESSKGKIYHAEFSNECDIATINFNGQ